MVSGRVPPGCTEVNTRLDSHLQQYLLTQTIMSSRLIVICGSTGVGKSRLAIEIATWLEKSRKTGARIINADAMQVYEGLDIITNKVPVAEQGGIEHLLMGFKKPAEQYVVGEWVRDAIRIVSHNNISSYNR